MRIKKNIDFNAEINLNKGELFDLKEVLDDFVGREDADPDSKKFAMKLLGEIDFINIANE